MAYPEDELNPCDECGWDHELESEIAKRWHSQNDPKVTPQLQEYPPEVMRKIMG